MKRQAYDVMDLKALRCFYIMAQGKSISQASITLGISEAAVSQRIKSLERYLEVKLYESRGGRIRLTSAGERTFSLAISVFDEIDDFEYTLKQGEEAGEITLSASDSLLRYLLSKKIIEFRQDHPLVKLRLLSRPVEESLRMIHANIFDLGIIAKRTLPKELQFQEMVTCPSCLILPKKHPLTCQARSDIKSVLNKKVLMGYQLIIPDAQQEGFRLYEALTQLGIASMANLEVSSIDTLKHYVSQGVGISLISSLSITVEDKANLEVITLPTEFKGETTYGIVTRYDKPRCPLLTNFIGYLLNDSIILAGSANE